MTRSRSRKRNRRRNGSVKLRCNRPVKSWRKGKKKMIRVCRNGRSKLIHFGDSAYRHNYSKKAKRSFRARHKCDAAERTPNYFAARFYACKVLWPKNRRGW